ncbi:MAG TPA: RHS repeat-associated core domain-containing protein [Rhabdochlamydiaceae bacterium]|nr:RHS repeat-associated core domain-containing protein [Rhabdochlamydiaceae bacterium]
MFFKSLFLVCLYIQLSAHPIHYSYDHKGRIQQITYPSGIGVTYSYDVAGRLITVEFLNRKTEYIYDEVTNRLSKIILPNGITTEYEYDKAKRVIALFHKRSDKTLIAGFRYKFDGNGNRIYALEITKSGSSEIDYFYDKLNRLIGVKYPFGYEKYTYDQLGNRLTKESNSGLIKYEYDHGNRLIQAGDTRFFYDRKGNLIKKISSDKTVEYVYDAQDHLIQYQDKDYQVSYTYDAQGHRLSKSVNGEITFYVNDVRSSISQVLAELNVDYTVKSFYVYGLSRLCQFDPSKLDCQFYLYDHPDRNVIALADMEQLCKSYTYEPFGTLKGPISKTSNHFTFAGEHYEEETGLIYLRNRYYDPEIGRFLSADPQLEKGINPQSFNPYVYVENNPINFIDPLGLKSARFCAYAPGTITEEGRSMVGHGFWILTRDSGDVITIGRYPKQPRFDDKIVPGTVSFEVAATDSQIDAILGSVAKGSYWWGIVNNCIDGLERGLEILGIDHPSFDVLGISVPTKMVMWIESLNGTDEFTKALEQDLKFVAEPDHFWPAVRHTSNIEQECPCPSRNDFLCCMDCDDLAITVRSDYRIGREKTQIVEVSSSVGSSSYEYDEVGNLIRIKDGNGNETHLNYDENYHLIGVIDAEGGVTRYSYNNSHDLTHILLPNGSLKEIDNLNPSKKVPFFNNSRE